MTYAVYVYHRISKIFEGSTAISPFAPFMFDKSNLR